MELTVGRQDLQNAIEHIIAAVPRKSSTPILSHIKVTADCGYLRMSATDLRVHATIDCRAEIETSGSLAIPADKLQGIVDNAGADVLSMSLGDGLSMTIVGDTRQYRVQCLDDDEYPEYPLPPGAEEIHFSRGVLPDLIAAVEHAAYRNDQKPHLCGVHLVTESGRLTAAATDGHRLSIASRELLRIEDKICPGITIPVQGCELIKGINSELDLTQAADSSSIDIRSGNMRLAIRLLEEKFPAFRRVVPSNLGNGITVQVADLLDAIKACGVMIEDDLKTINLKVSGGVLTVSALSLVGVASATVPVMGDDGLVISLNSRYLSQALKSLPGTEIFFKYQDRQSPVMLIPVDHSKWDERIEVLMPLRSESTPAEAPDPEVEAPKPSYHRFMEMGFSRDESKLLLAGYSLVRYDRPAKNIDVISSGEDRDAGCIAWLKHERSPFATYSSAERELKSILSQPFYIEVTMAGEVTGHKQSELLAAGFDLYRSEGIIPGHGHGSARIKCFSKGWGTWKKFDTAEECRAAWDELMKEEKALQG